jgi:hypothetical protein
VEEVVEYHPLVEDLEVVALFLEVLVEVAFPCLVDLEELEHFKQSHQVVEEHEVQAFLEVEGYFPLEEVEALAH